MAAQVKKFIDMLMGREIKEQAVKVSEAAAEAERLEQLRRLQETQAAIHAVDQATMQRHLDQLRRDTLEMNRLMAEATVGFHRVHQVRLEALLAQVDATAALELLLALDLVSHGEVAKARARVMAKQKDNVSAALARRRNRG